MVDELAPGVRGYSVCDKGVTYYPAIMATKPGSGDVTRFLDGLPRDQAICFPNVISSQLREMLLRRDFVVDKEWAPEFEEYVEVLKRS